ncbi:MAG: tRNA preQ1(34) S-adenosylmethionine ribosyltransferase-isomerase QueA [Kiritimatiellae bacterium]|nr:tRNA preQ1(34) S-adenosylmethionine ribosyltransferase-isomerase QueA [Kiritimatiellia bacterium]
MRTADFDYILPPERIAQVPMEPRDAARLMVLHRAERRIEHRVVRELPDLLRAGDLLVLNNTRVIPARLRGYKPGTRGAVEIFLLEPLADGVWDALLRARRRPKPGARVVLGPNEDAEAELLEDLGDGRVRVRLRAPEPFEAWLESAGEPPLPPYIRRAKGDERRAGDRERYQTVYARHAGAVAAPTAGLHFTAALLDRLAAAGIGRAELTLHVGIGTFRPVTAELAEDHPMEPERYRVPESTVEALVRARAAGGRIVAVGTTATRTLETIAAHGWPPSAGEGRSALFIRPPYEFKAVDALLTNFHLPCSTLLMLVSAFAGRELVREAYETAIREKYRFYSYGDAMLIL